MTTIKTGLFDTEDELSNRRVVDMSERMGEPPTSV